LVDVVMIEKILNELSLEKIDTIRFYKS
jgi:hypothetical protein